MADVCRGVGAVCRSHLHFSQVRHPQDGLHRGHRHPHHCGADLLLGHGVLVGSQNQLGSIGGKTLLFLVLSGLATGASWLCYYRALQDGPASLVAPIDKLSILVTVLFSYVVFHEKLSCRSALGLLLLVGGTLVMLV